jgi:hypothetical protein
MNKISQIFLLIYTVFLLLSTIGCNDKKEDTEDPKILVLQPQAGASYENGDTISFEAVFSDNSQLNNVEIQVVDADNKPMLSTQSFVPTQNPYTFKGTYVIDDPLLPGGQYQLRFRCSDGNNVTNKFVAITIFELNRNLLYPIIITHSGDKEWTGWKLENNLWKNLFTYSGDYLGSAVNSTDAQCYMCGLNKSDLTAYRLKDGLELWTVTPEIYQLQQGFTGMSFFYPYLYVASAEGNIHGFNKSGSEIYKSATYYSGIPSNPAKTQNLIISYFKDNFNGNNYLVAFHNSGGALLNVKYIQSDVVCLIPKDNDKTLVFSNKSGQIDISIYNGSDNSLISLHTLNATTLREAVSMDKNNFILSTNSGIYQYRYSDNSLSPFVTSINNAKIACDDTQQIVYICSGKKLEVYNFPFAALQATLSLPDTVVGLHLVYNK